MTMPLRQGIERFGERTNHLQQMKESFFRKPDAIAAIMLHMAEPLSVDAQNRTDDDKDVLELFLTLFKNLLQIDNPVGSASDYDKQLHDRIIMQFHNEGVLDMILNLIQQVPLQKERSLNFLLLEIMRHIFRMENAEDLLHEPAVYSFSSTSSSNKTNGPGQENVRSGIDLAKSNVKGEPVKSASRTGANVSNPIKMETDALAQQLSNMRQKEKSAKQALMKQESTRHSKFGTMIGVESKLNPGNFTFVTNVFADPTKSVDLKADSRVRTPLSDSTVAKRSYFHQDVRKALHGFAKGLLQDGKSYNYFMKSIIDDMDIDNADTRTLLPQDPHNFMFIAALFMELHRLDFKRKQSDLARKKKYAALERSKSGLPPLDDKDVLASENVFFDASCILRTLELKSLRFCTDKAEAYLAQKPNDWPGLTLSMAMYQQMVRCIYEMCSYGDPTNVRNADILRRNLFYHKETVDLIKRVQQKYEPHLFDKRHLAGLVASLHYMTKILHGMVQVSLFALPSSCATNFLYLLFHIISSLISYHIISYYIISYHIISYHIISYHIISYHIISYHIISYHIIK
jgi:hypothetical protein